MNGLDYSIDNLLEETDSNIISDSDKCYSTVKNNAETKVSCPNYKLDYIIQDSVEYEYNEIEIQQILRNLGIEQTMKFFIGLSFGLLLDEEKFKKLSYEKYELQKIIIYNKIQELFETSKSGILIRKNQTCCNIIAIIPENDRDHFLDKYIVNVRNIINTEYGISLHIGVGIPVNNFSQLKLTYESAIFAYNLYFFEPKEIIEYIKIHKIHKMTFDGFYEQYLEDVYRSVVAKDKNVFDKIWAVLFAIEDLHYGNKFAAVNRCIMFIGELGKKLKDLNPKAANWRIDQEDMQEKLRQQVTYKAVCDIIINFYTNLIPIIYQNVEKKNVYEIIEIKKYIQNNFAKDISLKEIADIMCVSHSYFSTFFKNATGKNFKTYLTEVRMEEALKLVLRTNMKTYEISEAVGYNNVRRFVDAFKSIYKMSPLEYRKVHVNK